MHIISPHSSTSTGLRGKYNIGRNTCFELLKNMQETNHIKSEYLPIFERAFLIKTAFITLQRLTAAKIKNGVKTMSRFIRKGSGL